MVLGRAFQGSQLSPLSRLLLQQISLDSACTAMYRVLPIWARAGSDKNKNAPGKAESQELDTGVDGVISTRPVCTAPPLLTVLTPANNSSLPLPWLGVITLIRLLRLEGRLSAGWGLCTVTPPVNAGSS